MAKRLISVLTHPHRHQLPCPPVEEILLPMLRDWKLYALDGVRSVAAVPMPAELRRIAIRLTEYRRGFHNAARIATRLRDLGFDCRYVTGYARAHTLAPIEHAWIRVGNRHYDPTWELFLDLGAEYVPIYELTVEELVQVMSMRHDDAPPSAPILRHSRSRI